MVASLQVVYPRQRRRWLEGGQVSGAEASGAAKSGTGWDSSQRSGHWTYQKLSSLFETHSVSSLSNS